MSSPEAVQPLFTRSPLIFPPHTQTQHQNQDQALFVTSPISTSPPPASDLPTKSRGGYQSSTFTSTQSSPVFETLSFEKIKIPSSTTASTDSEAFSSDYASNSNIQSPSLISCLFQSTSIVAGNTNNHSRKYSNSTTTSPYPSRPPSRNGSLTKGTGSKPILRRDTMMSHSTSASEDGFGLGIRQLPLDRSRPATIDGQAPTATAAPAPALRKRPSCLTFAVSSPTPRSSGNAKAGPSRSTSASPTSSYTNGKMARSPCIKPNWSKVRGQVEREIQEDEEEEDEDEEDDDGDDVMVDSPLPIPGHGESDEEDQGYVEDEEDGFTTDEDQDDDEVNGGRDRLFGNWNTVEWNEEYLITTPKRRNTDFANMVPAHPMTSTDDNDIRDPSHENIVSPRGRKTSICINTNTKPSSNRCTRHRSPPPPTRSSSTSYISAPPAARSPSAAGLCRRRGSGSVEHPHQSQIFTSSKKGWKSDDSAFFSTGPPIMKTNSFKLPSASAAGFTGYSRKSSLPTPKLEDKCYRSNSSTRSILKHSENEGKTKVKAESQPMIRSSGENKMKIPPKTPPLTNDNNIMVVPNTNMNHIGSVNLLRRGSAPVTTLKKDTEHLGVGVGNRPNCLARSATGYEREEEMGGYHHHHHKGIRIL
ncbi:hypothetical protein I203_103208 [Kwoniella mangroviensis CBS 8507]|uniref:uncharacterized protein n=1 Tax=Kwoniella mangroviensis CBS 8507 TaxID=1296122 RepID=UPI00080CC5DA|nr:uncharacterized protein I203_07418 [Kwoniella mangroviensis CBS 8507]OCF63354.1 hypothetical protein I203_07418 [Kwoniella mangroviensis CBS 8507]